LAHRFRVGKVYRAPCPRGQDTVHDFAHPTEQICPGLTEGWNEGFVSGLWLYPALGKGAAIMINSNQGWPLRDEIKEAIAREYHWPRPATKPIVQPLPAAIEGTYRTERGIVCEVTIDGTTLTLRLNEQPPIVFVLQKSEFVSISVNASLQFLPSMAAATAMVLKQAGQTFRFEK